MSTWLNYIDYEKSSSTGNHSTVTYLIEKAITYMCTCPQIWREYVKYLENEIGDRNQLLNYLHDHRKMLMNIDITLIFLEADLTELSHNLPQVQKIYSELDAFRRKRLFTQPKTLRLP